MPTIEAKFLLDTDVFVHIQSHPESESIYDSLIEQAKAGNVKTIRQVFDELKRWAAPYQKLSPHRKSFLIPDAEQYSVEVAEFVEMVQDKASYLCCATGGNNPDPADPWLIAVAKALGYTLVTDEKKGSSVKIPAACKIPEIKCPCISGPHFFFISGIITELNPEHISPNAFYGLGQ